MNKPHKWAKEIKAWADGAEIEYYSYDIWSEWYEDIGWYEGYEYRIKPQLKEPQYLYVFFNNNDFLFSKKLDKIFEHKYIGRIKLEDDD